MTRSAPSRSVGWPIQTSHELSISRPGDVHERVADQVADQVMQMPHGGPAAPEVGTSVGTSVARALDSARHGRGQPLPAAAMAIRAVSSSPGTPLDSTTRADFERRFGHSFADVRIHTDADAAAGARAVRARAFTIGDRIAFASGQYAPHSDTGRRLLAHELTHTLQQAGSPALGIQRQEDDGDASGCAVNGMSAMDAGDAADNQIQLHAHARDARLVLETVVPRADKGIRTPCPAQGTRPGRIDLSYFEEPIFYLAEIKSHRSWPWAKTEYHHYADRVRELEARVLGGGWCNEPGDRYDPEDQSFDRMYLNGYIRSRWELRNLGQDDFQRLELKAVHSGLVPTDEQDAGPFTDPGGQIVQDGLHLWYRNNTDGTVTYECRKTKDNRDNTEEEDQPEDSTPSEPQLELPFLRASHPLLDGWLRTVETQPVPAGHAYAVAVSAPIFNAFKFAAEGRLPWSRTGMTVQAVAEVFGEVLGAAGLLTVGGLMLQEAVPVATTTTETLAPPVATATTEAVATAPISEAELAAQAARAQAARAGTTAASAVVADPSLAVSPGQAASVLFPILASGLSPTEYSGGPTPDLHFAKLDVDQESGVPLPFTSDDQAEGLGRLAWDAIAALVPYSSVFDVTSRRELGLLRAAVLYANPAVIAVDDTAPDALPEISTVRDIGGHQYIVIGHYVGR